MMNKFDRAVRDVYSNMVNESTVIKEETVENLVKSILDEIDAPEMTETRRTLVADALAELSYDKEELQKLLGKFTKALMNKDFASRVSKVREVLGEIDEESLKDLESLRADVAAVYANPKSENRQTLKAKLLKVLAKFSDEELKKVVDAEKQLLKMVREA